MSRNIHTPETLKQRVIRCSADWSCVGNRLVDYLSARFTYRTAEQWSEIIAAGEILVNHLPAVPEQPLRMHDLIEYLPRELPEPEAELNYRVVFEDDDVLVVDKPGNLCVHPSGPFFRHTLWHMLCSHYGEIHFINRLDRETSGLLLAAKNRSGAARLQKKEAGVEKTYLAVVAGNFDHEIDASGFLVADTFSAVRKKRRFTVELPEGAFNVESCRTLLYPAGCPAPGWSLVRARLITGRTHQIRATLYSLGFPLIGDKLYGPDENCFLKLRRDALSADDRRKLVFRRQALHSSELSFNHPASGERLTFFSPLPPDIASLPVGEVCDDAP